MITSSVKAFDEFGKIDDLLDRKIVSALDGAAHAAAAVADERAHSDSGKSISTFQTIPAHGTDNGYASGIKARNPLWRIYDKGSLGSRRTQLKGRNRRKTSWTVRRHGTEYEAHRKPEALETGKGVAARDISNAARTAGRKALTAFLLR